MDDFVQTIIVSDDESLFFPEPEKDKSKKSSTKTASELNSSFVFDHENDSISKLSSWDYSVNGLKQKSRFSTSLEQKVENILRSDEQLKSTLKDAEIASDFITQEDQGNDNDDNDNDNDNISSAEDQDSGDESEADDEENTSSYSNSDSDIDELEEMRKNEYFETVSAGEKSATAAANSAFKDMSLSRPILKAIAEIGYKKPTKIQSIAIPIGLSGKDVCAAAETGSGKTCAFLIPIMERLLYRPRNIRASRVLIILPTRELAAQCYSVASKLGKHADISICLAIGGASVKVQEIELRSLPDVIIATPGRLVDHLKNCPSFGLDKIEILVLDEADRMLEIGFREELQEIIKMCPTKRQTLLFSATMTDSVDDLIKLSLKHPVKLFVDQTNAVASKLDQEFVRIRSENILDRYSVLIAMCKHIYRKRCIIFIQSKLEAHKACILFNLLGLKAAELHGSLSQAQRLESLETFRDGKAEYLIATDLASRGLDIDSVQTVINFHMPVDFKTYLHRVGRTARAGSSGKAVSLIGEADRKLLKMATKHSKQTVKHRKIPSEILGKYAKILSELQSKIKEIMAQEKAEKMLMDVDRDVQRAENLVIHEKEIQSRPPKTFVKKAEASKPNKSKHQNLSPDERKAALEQKVAAKSAKSQMKPKRLSAEDTASVRKNPTNKNNNKRTSKPTKGKPSSGGAFDEDLSLKKRKRKEGGSSNNAASSRHAFKSKKRYKRR